MCDVAFVASDEREKSRKRELARLRQQKCRQKAKASQATIQAKLEDLRLQLDEARTQLFAQQSSVCQARARLEAVKQSSASISNELQSASLAQPSRPQMPRVPRPEAAEVCQSRPPCCIFRKADNAGIKLRHRARISLSVVMSGWQTPFDEDMVIAFRERTAQRLGCRVCDICWLLENENCPALTRDGLVTSHLDTPACLAKSVVWWLATMVELALLLALEKRLARQQPTHPAPACADTAFCVSDLGTSYNGPPLEHNNIGAHINADKCAGNHADSQQPTHAAPEQSALDSGLEDSIRALTRHMHSVILGSQRSDGRRHAVSRDHQMQLPEAAQTTARMLAIVETVFAELLHKYTLQTHPSDVWSVCKRLQRAFSLPSHAADLQPLPDVLTSDIVMAVVLQGLCRAIARCLHDLRANPKVPRQPATAAEVERARTAVQQQVRMVSTQRDFCFFVMCSDRPSVLHGMAQSTHPSKTGVAQFEMCNLLSYKAMALSDTQKAALVEFWASQQAALRRLDSIQTGLAAKLATLPSETDLPHLGPTPSLPGCLVSHSVSHTQLEGMQASEGSSPRLIGVSPDATEAAAGILAGLRDCLSAKNELFIRHFRVYRMRGPLAFTAAQEAEWATATMPFLVDTGRIVQMAAADLRCARVYGQRAICS